VPVGHRKHNEDQAQRNQYHSREKFSHDPSLALMEIAGAYSAKDRF
jgi:hypothetical protein